ncbi:MAG: aldose epimerase family protein [Verrucomicrobiota bacterium]
MTEEIHGTAPDGRPVRIFTLTNRHGLRARVSELGAALVSMETPDRNGQLAHLTTGFDTFEEWLANPHYFGVTVGRFANRIAGGKFTLDGREYTLSVNNGPNHLHGGESGFGKKLWNGEIRGDGSVVFQLVSADGDEGYPGRLSVEVIYRLTDENEMIWEATARTDAPTIVNLVLHTYWNLSGGPFTTVGDHFLEIRGSSFLEKNAVGIPTGKTVPVEDTPMDFTTPRQIGERIGQLPEGYDHCWVLDAGEEFAARLTHPQSGRVMEILTNQPGLQVYSAHYFDAAPGRNGEKYPSGAAVALETQNFPDAPNQPEFPSALLRPGEKYHHTLVHRFSVD